MDCSIPTAFECMCTTHTHLSTTIVMILSLSMLIRNFNFFSRIAPSALARSLRFNMGLRFNIPDQVVDLEVKYHPPLIESRGRMGLVIIPSGTP